MVSYTQKWERSKKINWERARKQEMQHLSITDEAKLLKKDRAAKWLEKAEQTLLAKKSHK